jgi:hypothetical protein
MSNCPAAFRHRGQLVIEANDVPALQVAAESAPNCRSTNFFPEQQAVVVTGLLFHRMDELSEFIAKVDIAGDQNGRRIGTAHPVLASSLPVGVHHCLLDEVLPLFDGDMLMGAKRVR